MKRCEVCKVSVDEPVERCPLCYAILSRRDQEPELPSYPDTAGRGKGYNLLLRILFMLSLAAGVVCVTINILTFQTLWWSLIVIGNIAYMWVAIGTALRRHTTLGQNVFIQAMALAALLLLIAVLIDEDAGWAFDYVIPFLFVCATLSITIVVIVKRMQLREFILYFILTALLGFVPLLLMAVGLVGVKWPSIASAMYAGLSLVSLFILADHATKLELKKRFHI